MGLPRIKPSPVPASDGEDDLKYSRHHATTTGKQPQTLIDKHAHAHSEVVLRHWSSAILKALGICRARPKSPEGGAA